MSYLFYVTDMFKNGQLSTTTMSTHSSLEPKAFDFEYRHRLDNIHLLDCIELVNLFDSCACFCMVFSISNKNLQ